MAQATTQHILYYRNFCMYCWKVLRAVKALEIEIEVRNTWDDEQYLQELTQATGRTTVPVLKIINAAGESSWMPESDDIIRYLKQAANK